jgi:hypothetical protein
MLLRSDCDAGGWEGVLVRQLVVTEAHLHRSRARRRTRHVELIVVVSHTSDGSEGSRIESQAGEMRRLDVVEILGRLI